jgi:hypothetical protein
MRAIMTLDTCRPAGWMHAGFDDTVFNGAERPLNIET